MKYILGMAKSNLDLNGAKRQKMELDFLRIVYAVKELRLEGNVAQGYFLVMTKDLVDTIEQWKEKYKAGDSIIAGFPRLTDKQKRSISIEKSDNVQGMLLGTSGKSVAGRSSANIGKRMGEGALKKMIRRYEPNVKENYDQKLFPLGLKWDFYGIVE